MSPATTARLLAGLDVRRGRPSAAQWVQALAILAESERRPGHTLELRFTAGSTAQVIERRLPKDDLA